MRLIPLTLCCLALLTAHSVQAKTKPKPKPSPLTPIEQHCRAWGNMARGIAVDRDNGFPLTSTIATMRQELARTDASTIALAVHLTVVIYDTTAPPRRIQQWFEVGCLRDEYAPKKPGPLY